MRNLLNISDLSREDIDILIESAKHTHWLNHAEHKIMATLFFEPSTRTKLSFQTAMYRLGGKVIDLPQESSLKKGESEVDTVKTIAEYCDLMVIRHPLGGQVQELAKHSKAPVINAGDGANEHPTQALLDFFCIKQYFDKSFKILFTGDITHSRTISSLLQILTKYGDNEIIFAHNLGGDPLFGRCIHEREIENIIGDIDVLYMTRHQSERHSARCNNFVLTKDLVDKMKNSAIILHPLPRNEELPPEIDDDIRAKYFSQVNDGVAIRMTIINWCLGILDTL